MSELNRDMESEPSGEEVLLAAALAKSRTGRAILLDGAWTIPLMIAS